MANMNFGVNILPKANNTYTLGNSDYKWNIFANALNGVSLTNIITDVQLNGTSIISNNIANIPIASSSTLGTVKIDGYGLWINSSNGILSISSASVEQTKAGTAGSYPITPTIQHSSVFYGLAKAAGDSTQSASSNSVGTYTDGAKSAIQNMLGLDNKYVIQTNPRMSGRITIGEYNNETTITNYHAAQSLAYGYYPAPYGYYAIALGYESTASGPYSIASGLAGYAVAPASFAQGLYVSTVYSGQTTLGRFNYDETANFSAWTSGTSYEVGDLVYFTVYTLKCIEAHTATGDAPDFSKWEEVLGKLLVVGNGVDSNSKSNALTVFGNGDVTVNGDLYVGCNVDSTGGTKVATISQLPSTMVGATSSVAGTSGLVPAPTTSDVDKFLSGDGTWKFGQAMTILSYGTSTWAQFLAAYQTNSVVYCRASSDSNPANGSQTRLAFMAYVNNASSPTNVEFQYYRSMSSHSSTAMGDEVYVYKLTNASGGTWSVTTRKASIKEIDVASGSKLGVSWSSDKVTLSNTMTANDMPMSSSDATTTKAAIDTLNSKISAASIGTRSELLAALQGMEVNESKALSIYGDIASEAIGWVGRSSGILTKTAVSRWEILVYSTSSIIMVTAEVNTSTGALENIKKYVPQLFQTKEYSYNYSIPANGSLTITAANLNISTPTGYKPIAVVNVNPANDSIFVRGHRCDVATGNVAWLRNVAASTVTGTFYMNILYVYTG